MVRVGLVAMAALDATQTTFALLDEDHTLGNAVRYVLNQE